MHLHFDCFSGISGDMVLGALVDAGLSPTQLRKGLQALPIAGYRLHTKKVHRGPIMATKVDVNNPDFMEVNVRCFVAVYLPFCFGQMSKHP